MVIVTSVREGLQNERIRFLEEEMLLVELRQDQYEDEMKSLCTQYKEEVKGCAERYENAVKQRCDQHRNDMKLRWQQFSIGIKRLKFEVRIASLKFMPKSNFFYD